MMGCGEQFLRKDGWASQVHGSDFHSWLSLGDARDFSRGNAVSRQETLSLRLERSGAHHCRGRKLASGHILHPRARRLKVRARLSR